MAKMKIDPQRARKYISRSKRVDYMEGTREQVIQAMDNALASIPEEGRAQAYFSIETYGYPYDPTTYHGMHVQWKELESEDAWKLRLSDLDEIAAKRVDQERKEFERLSKIYGKTK